MGKSSSESYYKRYYSLLTYPEQMESLKVRIPSERPYYSRSKIAIHMAVIR